MEADDIVKKTKGTVMTSRDAVFDPIQNQVQKLLICQAEISFKAGMEYGIWLFAWWKDGVQYVGSCGKTLQEAYEELGLGKKKGGD